jgi:hypothetical protein
VLDFTTAATIELAHAIQVERKEQRDSRKWHRVLRDLRREAGGFVATPRRRKELRREFVSALDAAHAAGMTIDAYMQRGSRVIAEQTAADAELSERADWAGLNDAA